MRAADVTPNNEELVAEIDSGNLSAKKTLSERIRNSFSQVPLLARRIGILVEVLLGRLWGPPPPVFPETLAWG